MNVLTFHPDGTAGCLYTEVIDLRSLGVLALTRATQIEFNAQTQQWEVRLPDGPVLHTDPSRAACLRWESEHFNS